MTAPISQGRLASATPDTVRPTQQMTLSFRCAVEELESMAERMVTALDALAAEPPRPTAMPKENVGKEVAASSTFVGEMSALQQRLDRVLSRLATELRRLENL